MESCGTYLAKQIPRATDLSAQLPIMSPLADVVGWTYTSCLLGRIARNDWGDVSMVYNTLTEALVARNNGCLCLLCMPNACTLSEHMLSLGSCPYSLGSTSIFPGEGGMVDSDGKCLNDEGGYIHA